MMPGIFAGGALGGLINPVMSFVAATGAQYVSSGTSITVPSTPAGISNGDGIYAVVYGRSALTAPSGWTLVDSQANNDPGTGTTQTLYVYRKDTVTTADSSTSFNWQQASSGRMGLAYLVVQANTGTIVEAETNSAETDAPSGSSWNATVQTLTATEDNELFLIAAMAISATAGSDTWTAPTGATLRTTASAAQNRLSAATQSRNTGQSNATPYGFSTGGSPTLNYLATITIRLQAA